jgi:hypothetical protein
MNQNKPNDYKITGNRNKKNKETKIDKRTSHKINELEQEKIILQTMNDYLNEEKISLHEFMTNLSDKAKNFMVPTQAYVDLLLEGHFGDLNEKQKERLKIIRENVLSLNENFVDKSHKSSQ